jgi:hypothetical protein
MSGAEGGAELTAKVFFAVAKDETATAPGGTAAAVYMVMRVKDYRISQVRTNG